jgi:hypothetical protein
MHAVMRMSNSDNNKKCKQYFNVAFRLKNDCRAPLIFLKYRYLSKILIYRFNLANVLC